MSNTDPVIKAYFSALQAKSASKRWAGTTKEQRAQVMSKVALARKSKKSLLSRLTT